jgi:hypothetical protein
MWAIHRVHLAWHRSAFRADENANDNLIYRCADCGNLPMKFEKMRTIGQ